MLYHQYFQRIFLPLIFLLLAVYVTAVEAAGCVLHDSYDLGTNENPDERPGYVLFPSSDFLKGGITTYSDSSCQTPADFTIHFSNGAVHTSDANRAREICQSHSQYQVSRVWRSGSSPNIYECVYSSKLVTGPRSKAGEGPPGQSVDPSQLSVSELKIHAFDGMGSGSQFRRLSNYGVGNQAVIDMGFLDAVDVWGNIGSGFSVCFPQPGRIVFLDAATSPRTLVAVDSVYADGYTCAAMNRPGTMVLVGASTHAAAQTSTTSSTTTYTRRSGTDDSIRDAVALEDCAISPTVNLRLRAAPWGRILDVVPSGAEVEANARTQSWFFVAYSGIRGWIAAWLTRSNGDCPW